jgi:cell filamentation protein, protein adenylyltransferase
MYRRREAVSSLAIEGTQASLSDILSAEATAEPEREEVREVMNYVRAFDYGLNRLEHLPVSLRLIREIHSRLMQGVRGKNRTPGDFRTSQNWIGPSNSKIETAIFVPPPPEAMKDALADWERFLHDESELPVLVRCALMHYQFETIHPFLDGNGRIGRLLIAFYLVEKKVLPVPLLYVSPFFEAQRPQYYDLLQGARERGDFISWIEFFLTGVEAQAIEAVQTAERLMLLVEDFRRRLRTARIRGSAVQLVDHLLANPYLTYSRAAEFLSVTPQGASYGIQQLIRAGVLQDAGFWRQQRLFVAREILDLLEEAEEAVGTGGR